MSNQSENGVGKRDFFALLEKAGSMGRYQYLLTCVMSVANYLCGGITCILPFLYYQDPYECSSDLELSTTCHQHVCSLAPEQRQAFIPEPSMSTLGNSYGDYRCFNEKLTLNMYITSMLAGRCIGALVLILFGQRFGRKKFFDLCSLVGILGVFIAVASSSLVTCSIGLMLSAMAFNNQLYMSFSFISDKVAESPREKLMVVIQLFYGLGIALNPLWFYLLKDWRAVIALGYGLPALLACTASICFLKDTPMNIVTRQEPAKALADFQSIAKINQVDSLDLTEDQIAQLKNKYMETITSEGRKKDFSFVDLFRYDSLRPLTIQVLIVVLGFIFMFMGPAFLIDKFNLGLFANGTMIGASEVLAYIMSYFTVQTLKRNTVYKWSLLLSILCASALLFLWDQSAGGAENEDWRGVVILGINFIFRIAITLPFVTMFVHYNEIFPTQVRAIVGNLLSFSCSAVTMFIPLIIDAFVAWNVPIMLLFVVTSLLCLVITRHLPETFGVVPKEIIDELSTESKEKQMEATDVTIERSEGQL